MVIQRGACTGCKNSNNELSTSLGLVGMPRKTSDRCGVNYETNRDVAESRTPRVKEKTGVERV